jgi:spermidine/putrescine transport system ATP-binding protein
MDMGNDSTIEIANLTRCFGKTKALDRVSLTINQGELFSLLGPSGCGKTTLLRIIAGLDSADEGTVHIDGQEMKNISAHRRPVNTVFQSYALFPHFNVRENIAFGLRMKKVGKEEIKERVEHVMSMVEIQELAERKPNQLSGGQKQRVALARAIVNKPKVLLLDEPLAALDLKLRKQLQLELLNLQKSLGITFVYVTHDQEEAMVLSDRIAVMSKGKIEQIGNASELYDKPRTRFTSQFLGTCSLFDAVIRERREKDMLAETPFGFLHIAAANDERQQVTLAIRPEKVQLMSETDSNGENEFKARIEQLIYKGSETQYDLIAGTQRIQALRMNNCMAAQEFSVGQQVNVYLPPEALILLDD